MTSAFRSSATVVTNLPPAPPPTTVTIIATMTLREAAILLAVVGRTTGNALNDLYSALERNSAVAHERDSITDRASITWEESAINVEGLESLS